MLVASVQSFSQSFIHNEKDTTLTVEYRRGMQWAYREHNNILIGVSNIAIKDRYGKFFQLYVYIKNLDTKSILFQPENAIATVTNKKGKEKNLFVYTYDDYIKKMERKKKTALALGSIAVELAAGMAGHKTAYVSGWSPGTGLYHGTVSYYDSNAVQNTYMKGEEELSNAEYSYNSDQVLNTRDYLRITTIRPGEEFQGHINIKREKGNTMKVILPVGKYKYVYYWDLQNIK